MFGGTECSHTLQFFLSSSLLGDFCPFSLTVDVFPAVSLETLVVFVLYVSLELVPVCSFLYLCTCVDLCL